MPLPWPSIATVHDGLGDLQRTAATALLNRFADYVEAALARRGLRPHSSPLFRPWNLVVVVDDTHTTALFSPLGGGVAGIRWIHHPGGAVSLPEAIAQVEAELGVTATVGVSISSTADDSEIRAQAEDHAERAATANQLARVGDLTGFAHLEDSLRTFLSDHPNPEANVFLMMRFERTEQLDAVAIAVRAALSRHGLSGLRADDRAYHDDLWSNVQTYMLGCRLGIAIFEQIDQRDFNPNVSLELGFMFARRQRCLLLKERRLPSLHVDLVGRLYKEFDAFHIDRTVRAQVTRWIKVDLALNRAARVD